MRHPFRIDNGSGALLRRDVCCESKAIVVSCDEVKLELRPSVPDQKWAVQRHIVHKMLRCLAIFVG
jgi:hypothetical protein